MLQEHLRISLLHQLDNCSQMEDETRCSGASGLMEHAHALILHQAGRSECLCAMLKQEGGPTLHVCMLGHAYAIMRKSRLPHVLVDREGVRRCHQTLIVGASKMGRRRPTLML